MNIKKRVSLILLSAMLTTVSLGAISASANNHGDEAFTFYWGSIAQHSFSDSRAKTDTTSAYAKCNAGSGFTAYIFSPDHQVDLSQSNPYVRLGQEVFIRNRAYEVGFRSVCLAGVSMNTSSSGVWSPDSV